MSAVADLAPKTAPPANARECNVLLHDDNVNDMAHVVQSLLKCVPQLGQERAINIMLEAHSTGTGLVITCDQEPAEFYCESLRGCGLVSSIEPV